MGKKLKRAEIFELLKDQDIEDILDDEGISITDLRKMLTDKQKEAETSTGKAKEYEGALGKWQEFGKQIEPHLPALQRIMAGEGSRKDVKDVAGAVAEVWNDPLYKPLQGEFQRIESAMTTFGQAFQQMAQAYQQDRSQFTNVVSDLIEKNLESSNPYFKENKDKIKAYAKERGYKTWDDAIDGYRGRNVPEEVKKAEQIAREAGAKDAEEKLEASRSEMGGQSPVSAPAGDGAKKDYNKGWDNLATELKSAGIT